MGIRDGNKSDNGITPPISKYTVNYQLIIKTHISKSYHNYINTRSCITLWIVYCVIICTCIQCNTSKWSDTCKINTPQALAGLIGRGQRVVLFLLETDLHHPPPPPTLAILAFPTDNKGLPSFAGLSPPPPPPPHLNFGTMNLPPLGLKPEINAASCQGFNHNFTHGSTYLRIYMYMHAHGE